MPYGRFTIGGTLASTQSWSVGVNLLHSAGTTPTPTQMNTFAQAIYAAFLSNFYSAASNPWSARLGTTSNVAQCRTYWSTAPVSQGAMVSGISSGAAVAGGISPSLPPQVALVFSLRTNFAGRSRRGRSYLPLQGCTLDSTGHVTAPVPATIATNYAAFLSAVNTISVNSMSSNVVVQGPLAGSEALVTSVIVDNVCDTQRRRRDKILSTATGTAAVV